MVTREQALEFLNNDDYDAALAIALQLKDYELVEHIAWVQRMDEDRQEEKYSLD